MNTVGNNMDKGYRDLEMDIVQATRSTSSNMMRFGKVALIIVGVIIWGMVYLLAPQPDSTGSPARLDRLP